MTAYLVITALTSLALFMLVRWGLSLRRYVRALREERLAEAEHDAYRARVCQLAMDACKVWESPYVNVDVNGARVTNAPKGKPQEIVASYTGPRALQQLEADVYARIAWKKADQFTKEKT